MTWQHPEHIVLVGENPNLVLYPVDRAAVPADAPLVAASYWRASWSEVGRGEALVLAMGDGLVPDGLPSAVVLADNPDLGRLVAARFVSHFPDFAGWDVAAAPVRRAHLVTVEWSASLLEVSCSIGRFRVRLVWREMRKPKSLVFHQRLGGHSYGTSLVLVPCEQGSVTLDGERVPGRPRRAEGDFGPSSAFLTLAEVWTVIEERSQAP